LSGWIPSPGGLDGAVAASFVPQAAPNSIAGLFQVNVKVPCSVKAGNAAVVVQVGTGQSQKGITVALRDPTGAENYCPGQ
jgi:uncharacterized protein (TIGR03437 family)